MVCRMCTTCEDFRVKQGPDLSSLEHPDWLYYLHFMVDMTRDSIRLELTRAELLTSTGRPATAELVSFNITALALLFCTLLLAV